MTQRGVSRILVPTSAMQNAVHVGTKLGTSLARSLSWSRTRIRALAVRVREGWRYAPRLREQPEVLGRLLLDARRAQITLGVLFVLGLLVMPSVRDGASGAEMALGATVVGPCAVAAVPSTSPTAEQAPAGGRYIVEAALGQGGMGSVYRARDRVLGRTVALKQLFPELVANRELAQRFEQEARVLAQLAHPHIVQIFDLVVEPSGMWMAMELIDGGSLEDEIERGGALPLKEALRLARQMAEALAYAHAQGVVHRGASSELVPCLWG